MMTTNDSLKLISIAQKIDTLMRDLEDVAVLLDQQYQALERRVRVLELSSLDPITPLGPNATP